MQVHYGDVQTEDSLAVLALLPFEVVDLLVGDGAGDVLDRVEGFEIADIYPVVLKVLHLVLNLSLNYAHLL
jgi:hypothetical protein